MVVRVRAGMDLMVEIEAETQSHVNEMFEKQSQYGLNKDIDLCK